MDGTTVLEFGTYLAAPLLGKYLRSLGCSVTTIRRPSHARGAHAEHAYMTGCEHDLEYGKRIIHADFACREDRQRIVEHIRETDVLIENFASGVMQKHGFGYRDVLAINPRIIYVSIKGFASGDERYASLRAFDSVIMAASGVFKDMGLNRQLRGVPASFSPLPMASVYGSIFACFATAAAIFAERHGDFIEIPLASSLTEALVHNNIGFNLPDRFKNERTKRIERGEYPIDKESLEDLFDPFFTKYWCSNGRSVYVVCPSHPRHQKLLVHLLGLEEDARRIFPPNTNPYDEDCAIGFGCANMTPEQAKALRPLMRAAFLTKTSEEWERELAGRGVPVIAHRSTEEWQTSPHAIESGLVCEDENGQRRVASLGWLTNVRSLPDTTPGTTTWPPRANPERYEHLPLGNVRMICLCNVIAGPTISSMCARLGADVIKIDPVNPLYSPEISVLYGMACNTNKRSILLDIETPYGRRILEQLLRGADVLVVNCTPSSLERAKLTESHLAAINPRLILARFDAYGGPSEVTTLLTDTKGYDDNIQATIGVQVRFGGSFQDIEEHAHVGFIDVIAGVSGACTVVAALIARQRGVLVTARSSLAAVGQLVQYPLNFRPEPSIGIGTACRGVHVLHRCYSCANDEWIMVMSTPHGLGACDLLRRIERSIHMSFAEYLRIHTAEDVAKRIRSYGVTCTPLVRGRELRKQNLVDVAMKTTNTFQYLRVTSHPIGEPVEIVAPVAIRWTGNVIYHHIPAPKYGAQTVEILSHLNATKALFMGVASVSWSKSYLPYKFMCEGCMRECSRRVALSCAHRLCGDCMLRAPKCCPICSQPHEMDIFRLRQKTTDWKRRYGNWRRGEARGATDMERLFQKTITITRSKSF